MLSSRAPVTRYDVSQELIVSQTYTVHEMQYLSSASGLRSQRRIRLRPRRRLDSRLSWLLLALRIAHGVCAGGDGSGGGGLGVEGAARPGEGVVGCGSVGGVLGGGAEIAHAGGHGGRGGFVLDVGRAQLAAWAACGWNLAWRGGMGGSMPGVAVSRRWLLRSVRLLEVYCSEMKRICPGILLFVLLLHTMETYKHHAPLDGGASLQ